MQWLGLFKDGQIVCMAAMIEDVCGCSEMYVNEIQSFVSGKGYGKMMLQAICKKFPDVWWIKDFSADDSLTEYYRSLPFVSEHSWTSPNGLRLHAFYQASSDEMEKEICDGAERNFSGPSSFHWPEA